MPLYDALDIEFKRPLFQPANSIHWYQLQTYLGLYSVWMIQRWRKPQTFKKRHGQMIKQYNEELSNYDNS